MVLKYLQMMKDLSNGAQIDANLLKARAHDLGLKDVLLTDAIHRKIWEHLIILDSRLKLNNVRE